MGFFSGKPIVGEGEPRRKRIKKIQTAFQNMYDHSYDACPHQPPITKAEHARVVSAHPCSLPHMSAPIWMTDVSPHSPPQPPETHTLRLLLGSPAQPALHTANLLMVPIAPRAMPSLQHGSQVPTRQALPPPQTQTSLLSCPRPSSPCSQPLYFPQLNLYSIQHKLCCYLLYSSHSFKHSTVIKSI